jgi:phage shock protein C
MKIDVRKRLYRSRGDRRVAGVCAGVADYLGVDATLVRIAWVLFAIAGGPGVLLYIIMAAIVPEEPEFVQATAEKSKRDVYVS